MFDLWKPWKNPLRIDIPLHPYFIIAGCVAIVGVLVYRYFTHEMCYTSDCMPDDGRILCMVYEEGEHSYRPKWEQRRSGLYEVRHDWTLPEPATLIYEPPGEVLVAILDVSLTKVDGKILSQTCFDARSMKRQVKAAGF